MAQVEICMRIMLSELATQVVQDRMTMFQRNFVQDVIKHHAEDPNGLTLREVDWIEQLHNNFIRS